MQIYLSVERNPFQDKPTTSIMKLNRSLRVIHMRIVSYLDDVEIEEIVELAISSPYENDRS